jgi:hypothetical protein
MTPIHSHPTVVAAVDLGVNDPGPQNVRVWQGAAAGLGYKQGGRCRGAQHIDGANQN